GRAENCDEHLEPPSNRTAWTSLGLLLVSLVAVVGLAKAESPAIEDGVTAAGAPLSVVGVAIEELVLLAVTAVVGSLTVGLGSAMVLGGVVHLVIFAAFLFVAVIP